MGSNGKHLKMRLFHSGSIWDAIAFNQGDNLARARGAIDLVYTAGIDTWKGRQTLQLNVLDFRPAG